MDETMNTVEAANTAVSSEKQQEAVTEKGSATAPKAQITADNGSASGGEDSGAATENKPFLTIRYNHENKGLTEQQAAQLAQKGMRFEGVLNRLDYIAAQQNTTVEKLVDGVMQSMEDAKRAELQQRYGDETTVNELMELYHHTQREKYEKAEAERQAQESKSETGVNERIAEEFRRMKKDFPSLTELEALPKQVLDAAQNGMPLEYAYLVYEHNERVKAEQSASLQAHAARISAGSMAGGSGDEDSESARRYRNALWGF